MNKYEEAHEDDLDVFDDTAFCELCGNVYCLCCGCDCILDELYDDEEDE